VVAVDSGNDDSPPSSEVIVTTPPMPNVPTNVTATANSSTKVTVSWTETIPPNGLQISNYNVLRGASPTSLTKIATVKTTTYPDSTVVAGTTYYYAIQATDTEHDVSPTSATAKVTTP